MLPFYICTLPAVFGFHHGFYDNRDVDLFSDYGFDLNRWWNSYGAWYLYIATAMLVLFTLIHCVMDYRLKLRKAEHELTTYSYWQKSMKGSTLVAKPSTRALACQPSNNQRDVLSPVRSPP